MKKNKKGIKSSEYFKELREGEKVALAINPSYKSNVPKTFLGRTGIVSRKIKNAYEVKFLNGRSYKSLVIKPIHLKRINKI